MHPLVQNFLERPASHKIGFWVVSIIILAFVFWQALYSAESIKHKTLQQKVEDLTTQLNQETRIARNLDKFRVDVKDLQVKLAAALQELPDAKEIPDLLASVSNLARDAGLQVLLFKPLSENQREFYSEVPVSVGVQGTYHQVATFFDEVGRLPRIVNINQISLREPQVSEESVQLKVDCMATTFRYLSEEERKKQPEESKKTRKRR